MLGNVAQREVNIDTTKPIISDVKVSLNRIITTATDEGTGLADKPYSIDNTNWQENNEITISKSGIYTIYVKDKKGNIAEKKWNNS